jgi:MarR-like DNA-binding transcriptional regulator SgrR of sgrS sRNA
VNGYVLQGFRIGNKLFSYKAHKDYKNLVDGENIYKIQFFVGNKLLKDEKVTVFYAANTVALDTLKADWTKKNTPVVETKPVLPITTDPKKLYNKDQKLLEYTILVQSEVPMFREIAEKIQTKLEQLSVGVQIKYLPLSDIRKMVAEPNSSYDIILAGVNL